MNKKQFLMCKKLFGCIKHHQLLNEYVLQNFFAFYQTLLIVILILIMLLLISILMFHKKQKS